MWTLYHVLCAAFVTAGLRRGLRRWAETWATNVIFVGAFCTNKKRTAVFVVAL